MCTNISELAYLVCPYIVTTVDCYNRSIIIWAGNVEHIARTRSCVRVCNYSTAIDSKVCTISYVEACTT